MNTFHTDEPSPLVLPSPLFWHDRPVLVTGGTSFIGSTLVDALIDLGAKVRVIDNMSSGRIQNIQHLLKAGTIEFFEDDLRSEQALKRACQGIDTLFHLAAAHGGRGYVDLHQADCANNLLLDGMVFDAALKYGVRKVVFASSGCIYPLHIQTETTQKLYLTEDLAGPPYNADGMYGWAKLMGEMTLRTLHQERGLDAVSCRYFTVYGPRALENHAIIAMMARALTRQNPFEIWGDGSQVRNWTYITDIVAGTLLAGEKINDGTAINLGTSERITVLEAATMILKLANHDAPFEFQPHMPTGPMNRIASFERAQNLLGWRPRMPFAKGVVETFEWYRQNRDFNEVKSKLDELLLERGTTITL